MSMDKKQAIVGSYLTQKFIENLSGIEQIAKEADANEKTKDFVRDYFRNALFFHEKSGFHFTEEEIVSINKPVSLTHYGLLQNLRTDGTFGLKFSGPFQFYDDLWFRVYTLAMGDLLDKSGDAGRAVKRFYQRRPIDHIIIDWATVRIEGYHTGDIYQGSIRSLNGYTVCMWWSILDIGMAFALGQKPLEESVKLVKYL